MNWQNLLLLATISGIAAAQPALRSQFDAASVRPSSPGTRPRIQITPTRVDLSRITLRNCILLAYGLPPFLLSGGPSWIDSDLFDISATLPPGIASKSIDYRSTAREALQGLLEERFQLVLRRESKVLPVYVLVIAKSGLKITPGTPQPDGTAGGFNGPTKSRLVRRNVRISELASLLSASIGQPVIDRTELTGSYSFVLEWTKDAPQSQGEQTAPQPLIDDAAPIADALRDQLGLNLQRGKAPLEVTTIERVSRPTAN